MSEQPSDPTHVAGGEGEWSPETGAPGGPDEPSPDTLDLAFADLKTQLREQLARLGRLGRDVALAAAARIDADAAIGETALGVLELERRRRKRRRAQVKRLERLLERVGAVQVEPTRGRRRDLRRVARAVRRVVTVLTEPLD
jgi:hypothetical protein